MDVTEHLAARVEHRRYITLGFFVHEMLGMRSKNWYYNHLKDEGFPQRVYLPGSTRPALDYDECIAWQKQAATTPPWKPKRKR